MRPFTLGFELTLSRCIRDWARQRGHSPNASLRPEDENRSSAAYLAALESAAHVVMKHQYEMCDADIVRFVRFLNDSGLEVDPQGTQYPAVARRIVKYRRKEPDAMPPAHRPSGGSDRIPAPIAVSA